MGQNCLEAAQRKVAEAEAATEEVRLIIRRKRLAKARVEAERACLMEARKRLDKAITLLKALNR